MREKVICTDSPTQFSFLLKAWFDAELFMATSFQKAKLVALSAVLQREGQSAPLKVEKR